MPSCKRLHRLFLGVNAFIGFALDMRPLIKGNRCAPPQMMKVVLTKFNKRFGIAKMDAKAYIGPDLCCEAELTLILAK